MINIDMKMDTIAEVIGSSKGTEAAGNGIEAIKGEDFD
ncbi:hypothetical protein A2U01_0115496 [Trifolium medium]|uniref:Uncharacterized protein n=1 Tax=Trifolium medium TaxID=97028 RepID=A0A392W0N7_9FABA|nr:hypothetical protein [Trifolium medium]